MSLTAPFYYLSGATERRNPQLLEMDIRMYFSVWVDADQLDTAGPLPGPERDRDRAVCRHGGAGVPV